MDKNAGQAAGGSSSQIRIVKHTPKKDTENIEARINNDVKEMDKGDA